MAVQHHSACVAGPGLSLCSQAALRLSEGSDWGGSWLPCEGLGRRASRRPVGQC